MRRIFNYSILAFAVVFLSGCTLPFGAGKAGLQVGANPQSVVLMDGKSLGQTPVVQDSGKPGTHTIRIEPLDKSLAAWEGQVSLNDGTYTVIDRQLAADVNKSHGYTLSFEKLTNKNSSEVNVISFPDNTSLTFDGAPVGFTPFKGDSQTPGTHQLLLTSPGYEDMAIRTKIQQGFRLVVNAQLGAQSITPTPVLTPIVASPSGTLALPTPKIPAAAITPLPKQASSSAVPVPYILVLDTPTHFLRVRMEPSTSGVEVAQINPGDKFPYLDVNGSWFEIEYLKGKQGWVSSQYAKLVK